MNDFNLEEKIQSLTPPLTLNSHIHIKKAVSKVANADPAPNIDSYYQLRDLTVKSVGG